jgi:uncharacterized protein
MIVDVHTHTPSHRTAVPEDQHITNTRWRPDRAVEATRSWPDYDQACAAADVTVAFNIAVAQPLRDTGIPADPARINESTAEFVAAAPDRRIGFMSVNPNASGFLSEVERCHSDLGLVGIKLAPNYQHFDPLGDQAARLYALAERMGLPLMFHQGASPIREAQLRYAHPLLIDEIALRHPELRMVLAHMGHPWQRETIVTIRKHPNLWADVSALVFRPWSLYESLRLACEWGVTGKLLFGSDFPLATPLETMEGLRGVNSILEGTRLPPVPEEQIEGIIHRDALGALGIAHALQATSAAPGSAPEGRT